MSHLSDPLYSMFPSIEVCIENFKGPLIIWTSSSITAKEVFTEIRGQYPGLSVEMITGSYSPLEKRAIIVLWRDSKIDILIITYTSGSVGIDLSLKNGIKPLAVFKERPRSLAQGLQALARSERT